MAPLLVLRMNNLKGLKIRPDRLMAFVRGILFGDVIFQVSFVLGKIGITVTDFECYVAIASPSEAISIISN